MSALACMGSCVLFLAWLITVVICQNTGIRPTEITDTDVSLAGVSEEFAEAVDEEREERRAARRRERDKKASGVVNKVMPAVFLSYRRSDSQDVTGRIYDRLAARYTTKQVFKDVNSIPLGISFALHIQQKIAKANVALIIIGPDWLTATDKQGRRRLDDPGDFVRVEVETALRANIPVVPVLVSNAHMPVARELPKSIRKLVSRHGSAVRPDPDFDSDMRRLFAGIEHVVKLPIKPQARNPSADEKDTDNATTAQPVAAGGKRRTLRTLFLLFVILLLLSPIAFSSAVYLGYVDTESIRAAWLKKPGAKLEIKGHENKKD